MHRAIHLSLIALILTACGPGQAFGPTLTPTASSTPTSTSTPDPLAGLEIDYGHYAGSEAEVEDVLMLHWEKIARALRQRGSAVPVRLKIVDLSTANALIEALPAGSPDDYPAGTTFALFNVKGYEGRVLVVTLDAVNALFPGSPAVELVLSADELPAALSQYGIVVAHVHPVSGKWVQGSVPLAAEVIDTADRQVISPIGSGGFPLVAARVGPDNRSEKFIAIIELGTERTIATIPAPPGILGGAIRFSPDGKKLVFDEYGEGHTSVYIYDLESGEKRKLFDLPAHRFLEDVRWSPSQKWLSYTIWDTDLPRQIWIGDPRTGWTSFVGQGNEARWFPDRDLLLYRTMTGGISYIYNAATGANERIRGVSLQSLENSITSHDIRFTTMRNCGDCYNPDLDAYEFVGHGDDGRIYFHLFDAQTRAEVFLAHAAATEGSGNRFIRLSHLLPIISRGGYILFVRYYEYNTEIISYFTIWDADGSLPIEISTQGEANRLPDVLPVQLSPDETCFIALHISQDALFASGNALSYTARRDIDRILVIDIHTADVLYGYSFDMGGPWVAMADHSVAGWVVVNGLDIYWPPGE